MSKKGTKKGTESKPGVNRRDFLAGVSALPFLGLGTAKSALAATSSGDAAPDGKIARYGIFPSIGIARVGNSDEWFLGPEVPGLPANTDSYKDGQNRVKRQAVRFRVYGFTAGGRVVREVTDSEAKIQWSVRVANTKAAWYGFSNPLDNGEAAPGLPGRRRNADFIGSEKREELVIDSGDVSIQGRQVNKCGVNPHYRLEGRFWNTTRVYLGELRTDREGRLIFLGGRGKSESMIPLGVIDNFSDNDAWYDDWSDGFVQAEIIRPDGSRHAVDPAWVSTVGPDYAPEIPPVTSLYDTILDMAVDVGWESIPKRPSFRADIYPIFHSLGLMEWVADASFLHAAWLDVNGSFLDPAFIARLADPSPGNREFRRSVFRQFRRPDFGHGEAEPLEPCLLPNMTPYECKLPYMLGDGVDYPDSPIRMTSVTKTQYRLLQLWSLGDFVDDFEDTVLDNGRNLDEIPLALRPAALTRAGLDTCSGGNFHPGVELTWSLRHEQLYVTPKPGRFEYRLQPGDRRSLLQDVGRLLTPEKAFHSKLPDGPAIAPVMPGDLTRWMGIPWQPDAFSCQSVEFGNDFPVVVWWPALLPVDVLPEVYYKQVMDPDLPPEERLRFFDNRLPWSRGVAGIGYHVSGSYVDGLNRMVSLWDRMGFIVERPGPTDPGAPPEIPGKIFVEIGRGNMDLDISRKGGPRGLRA